VVAGECTSVVGMPERESKHLLDEWAGFIARPANVYAHKSRVGDVVMWDNITTPMRRCT
jgi:alpha-ketoglutarate-dependent taurine dioxygenase